ncbi:MAG: YkgJ family cysteine cluster protein [Deltaproteobacteria bacterium]|nr:YkgJ family cysteine cluster protein [Deltaproteobacteria bacterium]
MTPEAKAFRCTGCGACCSEFWINVSDADVRRICADTGLGVMEVVEFASPATVEGDVEEEGWVPFGPDPADSGLMTLKTDPETSTCRFLQDSLCTIYESRPMACRLYPWDRDYPTYDSSRIGLEILTEECPYENDGDEGVDALDELFDQDDREGDAYEARIETWRRLGAPDDPVLFLRFLRFPLNGSVKATEDDAITSDAGRGIPTAAS